MKKTLLLLIILFISLPSIYSQQGKKTLDHDVIEAWKRITETAVSSDGKLIAYKTQPWKGDTELFLYNSKGEKISDFKCGASASFTYDSRFLVFDILPESARLRELMLLKTKKEELPLKSLGIYNSRTNKISIIERSKGFRVPEKWSGWIAYQTEPEVKGNTDKANTAAENQELPAEKSVKSKKESSKNGYTLQLLNPETGDVKTFPFVDYYAFAKEKNALLFTSTGDDEEFTAGLYLYNFINNELKTLYNNKGEYKQITLSDDAAKVAFLFNEDEKPSVDKYKLCIWKGSGSAEMIVDNSDLSAPGWIISENGRLQFSENGKRVFFGTAPEKHVRDTTILEDEFPLVDIWNGSEGYLHTVQVVNRSRDLRKSWMAAFDLTTKKLTQLGTMEIDDITLIDKGNSDYVLAVSNVPYMLQAMWEGGPNHYDVYLKSIVTGETKLIKKNIRADIEVSPSGKFLSWYDYLTESIYTFDIATGKEYRVTSPDKIVVAQEINDIPNPPGPYRPTGWLDNDTKILLNDRYDIWMVDPTNRADPVNLTKNGRLSRTEYRNIVFDRDKRSITPGEDLLLLGVNELTKESGYYTHKAGEASVPKRVLGGKYSLSSPVKAEKGSTLVYTFETYELFPDLHVSDIGFKKSIRISEANPQQKNFLWGSAELVKWISLDGMELEGLLYKPENFDPAKKYPMIVNFYEKSSDGLYSYRTPELHRSTIDYHYYTSNGYVVFNPNVHYETGYPGEGAYNCVMPGVTALIEKGFIDKDRIGAQGHSWGGYQVAYLATRTDLFAAIESGAPVVNMFSAYGGIRWGSGLNRSFQYEHTQSRIGASIWESPLRYIENSPLFTMDKVTTPILILANDGDGSVPWYQGIEYFMALRRLQKPVWMLNYNGEDHWPQKLPNKKDFQIRMAQFFDHYLKDKAMPLWMKEGVPAIMKDYELGYELIEK